jgi:hypothetical protein
LFCLLRLRKNLTISNYQFQQTFADPTSGDFAKEKGIREDQVRDKGGSGKI